MTETDNPQIQLPEKYRGQPNEDELRELHKKMLFDPGEAIGVVAAQSISEPATQMTMETYHSAGAAKVSITQGLPRLIEIINARRNPKTPIMNIYLTEGNNSKEDAKEVAAKIREVTFDDVVSSDTLDLTTLQLNFTLNENMLDEYRIDTEDIVAKLKDKLKANVEADGNEITLYPNKDDYDLTDLQDMKAKAMDHRLQGFKRIEDVVILEEQGEWRVQTAGINMRKVLRLDKVDESRTRCNDLFKFKKVFGVEGVRNLILEEMHKTLDEQGMAVDDRWLMLIADTMTKEGDIKGATRYGICGDKHSVLARSAFEETKKHLKMAAVHGEHDPLNSVVENIILGQLIPIGTGNLELAPKAAKAPDSVLKNIEEKRKELREEKERKMEARREAEEAAAEEAAEDADMSEEEEEGSAAETAIDYDEMANKNIAEIKELVPDTPGIDLEKLLAVEKENKDRKTLKKWLNDKIAESEG